MSATTKMPLLLYDLIFKPFSKKALKTSKFLLIISGISLKGTLNTSKKKLRNRY